VRREALRNRSSLPLPQALPTRLKTATTRLIVLWSGTCSPWLARTRKVSHARDTSLRGPSRACDTDPTSFSLRVGIVCARVPIRPWHPACNPGWPRSP
jgi:hypothetical protein